MTSLCLTWKISKLKFFNILRRKEGLILKLGQLIEYHKRKYSRKRYAQSVHQKLVPEPYLILINGYKYSLCIQETLLEIRWFKEYYQRSWINRTLFLFPSSVSFYGNYIKIKSFLELVSGLFSCYQLCS